MLYIRRMSSPIDRAIESCGGMSALARAIGVTAPAVHEWRAGKRPVPIERCVQIERATNGTVRRWALRPTDWHRIWPELVGVNGAPVVPAPEDVDSERAA